MFPTNRQQVALEVHARQIHIRAVSSLPLRFLMKKMDDSRAHYARLTRQPIHLGKEVRNAALDFSGGILYIKQGARRNRFSYRTLPVKGLSPITRKSTAIR